MAIGKATGGDGAPGADCRRENRPGTPGGTVNRALPAGDRGCGCPIARGASGRGRAVPRARRLVGGVAADRAGRQGQGCNAARSQVALVMTERKPSVQEVRDFTRKAVAAVNFARPNFVERRAKAGILAQFQSAHAAAEIALGGFSGLVDRADDRHRFVLTVLALGDEHRQAQVGVGLEWNRKSVVSNQLFAVRAIWFLSMHHN